VNPVVERLEASLGRADGPPIPLDGGITNRNFRVSFAGRDCVVRLPGRATGLLGINRESERLAGRAAARLGLAPEVLAADADCLVTAFLPSHPLDPGQGGEHAAALGTVLRTFHAHGPSLPSSFWVPELIETYASVVAEHGGELPAQYGRTRKLVARVAEALPLRHPVPCHNDLLPGNILIAPDGGVCLVDWEYAGMGHPMFDLGNLAVNTELDAEAETLLLGGYFGKPPDASKVAALKLMRIMSDAREAAWGVIQSVISELDFDFQDYALRHFARMERAADDPDLEEWLSAAAA
jgi:hypothetical protein